MAGEVTSQKEQVGLILHAEPVRAEEAGRVLPHVHVAHRRHPDHDSVSMSSGWQSGLTVIWLRIS